MYDILPAHKKKILHSTAGIARLLCLQRVPPYILLLIYGDILLFDMPSMRSYFKMAAFGWRCAYHLRVKLIQYTDDAIS